MIDRQGNTLTELALAELLESGEVKRHIRKCKKLYKARRDHCITELNRLFGDRVSFHVPAGGLAFWLNLGDSSQLDLTDLALNSYFFNHKQNGYLRFGFGALTEWEATDALTSLKF